jgi:hypothetical protein
MAKGRRRKNERALPSEEKRERKSKKSKRDSRGPCSPFYKTRGAGYIGEERERGRRAVHARQVCGGGFSSCSASRCPSLLLLLHVVVCLGVVPLYACGRSNEFLQHLAHAWEMRTQNYSGGLPTSLKLSGWRAHDAMDLIYGRFPLRK